MSTETSGSGWWAVVVHYGDPSITERALQSINPHDFGKTRLTIVHNGPGAAPVPPEWMHDKCEMVVPGENLGYAAGANLGAQRAFEQGSRWTLLLNNDVRFTPNFFSSMKGVEGVSRVGLASPVILWDDDSQRLWFSGSRINWLLGSFAHRSDPFPADSRAAAFATGCCLAVSRECYERCGLYRDRLRFYCEDADLSLRARNAGFDVICWGKARLLHSVSAIFGANRRERTPPEKSYYCSRNLFWIGRAHLSPLAFCICAGMWTAKFTCIAVAQALRGRVRKSLRTLKGVWDGLWGSLE